MIYNIENKHCVFSKAMINLLLLCTTYANVYLSSASHL